MAFIDKLKQGLFKTRKIMTDRIDNAFFSFSALDDELFWELEEILICADVGSLTASKSVKMLKENARQKKITEAEGLKKELKHILESMLITDIVDTNGNGEPKAIVMVGVNGTGKTTSAGKIAKYFLQQGKTVMFAAGDTFRAAASEQLEIWSSRVNAPIVRHGEGADPAAVVYDAIKSAKARAVDIIICDTAGRLQNKKNLMDELSKILRVIKRELTGSEPEVLLVLDATTGQNAITQAKEFAAAADVTGIVLSKLDGSAKGGAAFGICSETNIPIKFIGVGEGVDDLRPFTAHEFTNALLD